MGWLLRSLVLPNPIARAPKHHHTYRRPFLPGAGTQTVTPAAATTSALAALGTASSTPPRPWERPGGTANGMASTSYGGAYGGTPMYSRCEVVRVVAWQHYFKPATGSS